MRSAKYGKRKKKTIIYDSYINPKIYLLSVAEILNMFSIHNLKYYSSWPPIIPPVMADSEDKPLIDVVKYEDVAFLTELVWMIHNQDDTYILDRYLKKHSKIIHIHKQLISEFNDITRKKKIDIDEVSGTIKQFREALVSKYPYRELLEKIKMFLNEFEELISLIKKGNKKGVKKFILTSEYIFKGACGLGNTYFVGYKEEEQK